LGAIIESPPDQSVPAAVRSRQGLSSNFTQQVAEKFAYSSRKTRRYGHKPRARTLHNSAATKEDRSMSTGKSFAGVRHIFCPTDLTAKSQKALVCAMQMAEVLGSKLTAFHSSVDSWLYQTNGSSVDDLRGIQKEIKEEIHEYSGPVSKTIDFDLIVE